jgi:hypothetical protein
MKLRLLVSFAVVAAGLSCLPTARACIEVEPRLVVEFAPGSAKIPADQMIKLIELIDGARDKHGPFRVAVRGYADRSTNHDVKTWDARELALADARARALSEVMRTLGQQACVTRVALGNVPDDAPADRTTEAGEARVSRGLVVYEKPDTEYAPREGLKIETDCGPPPTAAASPSAAS